MLGRASRGYEPIPRPNRKGDFTVASHNERTPTSAAAIAQASILRQLSCRCSAGWADHSSLSGKPNAESAAYQRC